MKKTIFRRFIIVLFLSFTFLVSLNRVTVEVNAATPVITGVEITSGAYKIGDAITVTIIADVIGHLESAITINEKSVTGFTDVGSGIYTVIYTVASGDTNRASVGVIPISIILTDGSNPSTEFTAFASVGTVTIDANVPTISTVETQDLDNNGKLDALKITFNENILDATVTSGNFVIAGYTGEDFAPSANSDVADNGVIYITFTEGSLDNEATPAVTYTAGTLTDSAGNSLATASGVSSIDKAAPSVLTITNSDGDGVVKSGVTGVIVTVEFSETLTVTPKITISGAETVSATDMAGSGTTWTYTLPTIGSGDGVINAQITVGADAAGNVVVHSAATTGLTVDNTVPTISGVAISSGTYKIGDSVAVVVTADATGYSSGVITINGQSITGFNDESDNTYTMTYTVVEGDTDRLNVGAVSVSVVLIDPAGNSSAVFSGTPTSTGTVTIDANVPTISTVETQDLDNNGKLDALKITFNEDILDASVTSGNFVIAGYTGEDFAPTANSDVADNGVIYITFTEGTLDNEAIPAVTYTAGTLTDSAGNTLLTASGVSSIDKAAPAVLTITNSDADGVVKSGVSGVIVTVEFSEILSVTPKITLTGEETVSATDMAGSGTTWTYTLPTIGSGDGVINAQITVGADAEGNVVVHSAEATGLTVDNTVPVITASSGVVNTEGAGSWTSTATASDNIDGNVTGSLVITYFKANGTTPLADLAAARVDLGSGLNVIVKYNVDDAATNSATEVIITLTANDNTVPVITLSGLSSITIEASQSAWVDPGTTVSDNYSSGLTTTTSGVVDNNTSGVYLLVYDVTDAAGNVAVTVQRTVTVTDTTAPTFNAIGNQTVEVNTGDVDWSTYITSGLDNSDTVLVKAETADTVNYTVTGSGSVTVTLTDGYGNVGSGTFTVTVSDTTAPVITLSGASEISVEASQSAWVDPGTTVSDNYSSGLTTTTSGVVDNNTSGVYLLEYDVTDGASNAAVTVTRTVTVTDTTAPTFNAIGNQTVEVNTGDVDWSTYITSGLDNSDTVLVKAETVDTVNYTIVGSGSVTVTLTDGYGNVGSGTFTVTVSDTTAPVISGISNASYSAGTTEPNWLSGVTAVDNLDGSVSVTYSGVVDMDNAGDYVLTYTATDAAANVATPTRTITITGAVQATVISVKSIQITSNVTTIEVPEGGVFTAPTVEARYYRDDTTINVTSSITGGSEVDTSVPGTYTLVYSVTYLGLSDSLTVTVTVVATDSDSDGASDVDEVAIGSDPLDSTSTPDDIDGDGFSNAEEISVQSNHLDKYSTPLDLDGDGFTNAEEINASSDQFNKLSTPFDIDGDGFSNVLETNEGSDPNDSESVPGDIDGNGILDELELDTDGDGVPDVEEIEQGTDPVNSSDAIGTDVVTVVYKLKLGLYTSSIEINDTFDIESIRLLFHIGSTKPDINNTVWSEFDAIADETLLENQNVYILILDNDGHKTVRDFTDEFNVITSIEADTVIINENKMQIVVNDEVVEYDSVKVELDSNNVNITENGDDSDEDVISSNIILSNELVKFVSASNNNDSKQLVVFDMSVEVEYELMTVLYRVQSIDTTILMIGVNASEWSKLEIVQGEIKYIELSDNETIELMTELTDNEAEETVSLTFNVTSDGSTFTLDIVNEAEQTWSWYLIPVIALLVVGAVILIKKK